MMYICSSSGGDIRGPKKREEGDETQFTTTRIGGKTSLGPSYFTVIKTIRKEWTRWLHPTRMLPKFHSQLRI